METLLLDSLLFSTYCTAAYRDDHSYYSWQLCALKNKDHRDTWEHGFC